MDAKTAVQTEVSTLNEVVLQNQVVLDLLTVKERVVCVIVSQPCGAYVAKTHRGETHLQTIQEKSQVVHWGPQRTSLTDFSGM